MNYRLKQISAKIDADTLEKIDEFARRARYPKRNGIINAVLTSVFFNASDSDIWSLIRAGWDVEGIAPQSKKVEISVKLG